MAIGLKEAARGTSTRLAKGLVFIVAFEFILAVQFSFLSTSEVREYAGDLARKDDTKKTNNNRRKEARKSRGKRFKNEHGTVKSADDHNANTAILPLLPWEVGNEPRPENIPYYCDLGTVSQGAALISTESCGGGMKSYKRTFERISELLPSPIDMMEKSNKRRTEIVQCDVCRILDVSSQRNVSIAFWGDSVHRQIFGGFLCEIYRRGYDVVIIEPVAMADKVNCPGVMCLREVESYLVRSPSWSEERMAARINFFFQYKVKPSPTDIYKFGMSQLFTPGASDVIFFNFGLHFNLPERKKYEERMQMVLDILQKHVRNSKTPPLIIFRETSSQHFNTPHGEYGIVFNGNRCVPHNSSLASPGHKFGWRDEIVASQANRAGFDVLTADPFQPSSKILKAQQTNGPELAMVPFNAFSGEFWDLHGSECTHYCSTPHLWQPLWRSIRLAMDRRYSDKNHVQ